MSEEPWVATKFTHAKDSLTLARAHYTSLDIVAAISCLHHCLYVLSHLLQSSYNRVDNHFELAVCVRGWCLPLARKLSTYTAM